MNSKVENIKNFINQAGKENQLFLFVGSSNKEGQSNSSATEIETWKETDFAVKLAKDNLVAVVPNVTWSKSRVYTTWDASVANEGNYYVYNETNGYVYLCLSNNPDNRIDLEGKVVSTFIPNHVSGDYTYGDGYTWKALYRITPNLEKFVSDDWIPIVSFDIFDAIDKNNLHTQMDNFCYPNANGASGNCSIYFKQNTQYFDADGDIVNGTKGSVLYTFQDLTCDQCYNMFKDHPTYMSVFSSSTNPSTIEIKDTYDIVGEMIQSRKIAPSSPYYYLYQANQNAPNEGYIVSVKIDLSSFQEKDRIVTEENPQLTLLSNSGSGGGIRLKTYNYESKNFIYGIEITSIGSGYKDLKLDLTSASLSGTKSVQDLMSVIKVNLDEIDGLGFDPMKILNSSHVMIDSRIDKPTLDASNLSIPQSINFYSLIQNPKYVDNSFESIAGTTENKYISTLYRTTTKLILSTPTENPQPNSEATITKEDGTVLRDLSITNVKPAPAINPSATATAELKGIEYTQVSDLVNSTIDIDGTSFTIQSIDESPSLVQYSGKILSTNKTTTLQIDDVDTALIRINMVKGM